MIYFFIVSVSFIIVFLTTPTIRYLGLKLSAVDKKNHRKIHTKIVVSKFGGIAIYMGFWAGVIIFAIYDFGDFKSHVFKTAGLMGCTTLMLFLGVYDDLQGSNAQIKFVVQTIIALLLIKVGFIIERIVLPGFLDIPLGVLSVPVTVLWFVGITNAINLIDGLDGLAAGIVSIISLFFCLYGLVLGEKFMSVIALALFGSTFAFLRYNFYPAKIFMGDSGSLFLGCLVASFGTVTAKNGMSNLFFIPAILVLFLPILDTFIAIVRRLLRRQHIFLSDACHIHHYYLKKGFTQIQTVLGFYVCTSLLGLIALCVLIF